MLFISAVSAKWDSMCTKILNRNEMFKCLPMPMVAERIKDRTNIVKKAGPIRNTAWANGIVMMIIIATTNAMHDGDGDGDGDDDDDGLSGCSRYSLHFIYNELLQACLQYAR